MAKKDDEKKEMTGSLTYKGQDSRKGTYHPYTIHSSDGMVGTVYFPKNKQVPDKVILTVEG